MATTTTVSPPGASSGASRRDEEATTASAAGAQGHAQDQGSDVQGDAASTDHIIEKPAAPLTKRQKIRRHCGRFWLWYLVTTIVALAIFLPILFKVIIPAIVQAIINSQGFPVEWGRLDCISATQMKLAMNTSLDTPIPARMSDFTLDLFNRGTSPYSPFANLTIAGQRINGNTRISVPPQQVTVQSQTELVKWFTRVFQDDKVELSIRGHPTIHLGALTTTANIDKTVSLPAVNKLAGIGITSLQLMLPPVDNKNLKGVIRIPNQSVLTLNLGNITFDLQSGKVNLGRITAYDLLLNAGSNNTMNFDGYIDLPNVVKNLGAVLQSQQEPLSRGMVNLNLTATQVMVHGESIPYMQKTLSSSPITIPMSVITLVGDVLSGLMGGGGGGGGGGGSSIFNVLGDVVGNNTFLQHVMDNYNQTQIAKKLGKPPSFQKRASDPKEALMWNMLKLGLRMKLNQANS